MGILPSNAGYYHYSQISFISNVRDPEVSEGRGDRKRGFSWTEVRSEEVSMNFWCGAAEVVSEYSAFEGVLSFPVFSCISERL